MSNLEKLGNAIEKARQEAMLSPRTRIPMGGTDEISLRDEIEALSEERCRDIQVAMARAACKHVFGEDQKGNPIVPAQGAGKKLVKAVERAICLCRRVQWIEKSCEECADYENCEYHAALAAAQGESDE